MPNRPIPIELDKTRHLYFDFNALVVVGENIDVPIQELLANYQKYTQRNPLKVMRALLLGGLSNEDNSLTLQKVGVLLDPLLKDTKRFIKVGEIIRQAFFSAFMDETGEAEKKDEGRVPTATIPKSRGRGKNT
jgi:hypothetical protein